MLIPGTIALIALSALTGAAFTLLTVATTVILLRPLIDVKTQIKPARTVIHRTGEGQATHKPPDPTVLSRVAEAAKQASLRMWTPRIIKQAKRRVAEGKASLEALELVTAIEAQQGQSN